MRPVYHEIIALSSQNTVYWGSMVKTLYPFKLFVTSKPIFIGFLLSLAINLGAWFWLYFGAVPRGEDAVLHYSILFQVDRLGAFGNLYHVPAIGLGFLLLNTIIAWLIYNEDSFLAELIVVVTTILELGVLAAASVLVFLNG